MVMDAIATRKSERINNNIVLGSLLECCRHDLFGSLPPGQSWMHTLTFR